eukprot:6191161-Pleurochrysis_carterae.AAC.1
MGSSWTGEGSQTSGSLTLHPPILLPTLASRHESILVGQDHRSILYEELERRRSKYVLGRLWPPVLTYSV